MRDKVIGLIGAALLLILPGTALAQESGDEAAAGQEYVSPYLKGEDWTGERWLVSGFGGRVTGGTSVGFTENIVFRSQFEQGTDTTWGFRVGRVVAPRFDVELEYGRSSPGLNAVLTDLAGQGRTEVSFADMDLNWLTAAVNYSVIERSRQVVPYLTLGVGRLGVSSSTEPGIDSGEIAIIFGLGVRVRTLRAIAFRTDVRGLRSGIRGKQEDPSRPAVLDSEFSGTNLLWTVGLELRF